jgi:hypothetical protein
MSSTPVLLDEGIFLWLTSPSGPLATSLSYSNVFIGFVPEGSQFPCLMFEQVSESPDTTLDGPSGFASTRFQFNFYGKDVSANTPNSGRVSARMLQDMVRLQFNGLTGVLANGIQLFNVILMSQFGHYNAEDQIYQMVTDYKIIYRQPLLGDTNYPAS